MARGFVARPFSNKRLGLMNVQKTLKKVMLRRMSNQRKREQGRVYRHGVEQGRLAGNKELARNGLNHRLPRKI
jgi:hypothetical protein